MSWEQATVNALQNMSLMLLRCNYTKQSYLYDHTYLLSVCASIFEYLRCTVARSSTRSGHDLFASVFCGIREPEVTQHHFRVFVLRFEQNVLWFDVTMHHLWKCIWWVANSGRSFRYLSALFRHGPHAHMITPYFKSEVLYLISCSFQLSLMLYEWINSWLFIFST